MYRQSHNLLGGDNFVLLVAGWRTCYLSTYPAFILALATSIITDTCNICLLTKTAPSLFNVTKYLTCCFSIYKLWINNLVSGGNAAISEKWRKEFLPEHCVSSVEIFDPETETWSPGPELPNALCGAGKCPDVISQLIM